MLNEEFVEEGIVTEVKEGSAVVNLQPADHCEECSAKIFCKTGDTQNRLITVKDKLGVSPGDRVRVSISGSTILKSSFILYGIPLILLLLSLVSGMKYFTVSPELKSSLISIFITALYYLILYLLPRIFPSHNQAQPEITNVITSIPGI